MMRHLSRLLAVAVIVAASPLFADKLKHDGFNFNDITIVGVRNGELATKQGGKDRMFSLDKIEAIEIDNNPKFTEAEKARSEPKKAIGLYQDAQKAGAAPIKQLATVRMIAMLDADGRYTDAIRNFLDIYKATPTASVWNLRPNSIPAAGSTMLTQSADLIGQQLAAFKAPDAVKNLKLLQLELYTKAGSDKAAALAKELGVGGTVENVTPDNTNTQANTSSGTSTGGTNTSSGTSSTATPPIPTANVSSEEIRAIEALVAAKKSDEAITKIDAALNSSVGETAVKLYQLRAQASLAANKQDEAAVSLLRIATHYPQSPSAPGALLAAADLQKTLKREDAAKRLYKELVEKYGNSREAAAAKKNL